MFIHEPVLYNRQNFSKICIAHITTQHKSHRSLPNPVEYYTLQTHTVSQLYGAVSCSRVGVNKFCFVKFGIKLCGLQGFEQVGRVTRKQTLIFVLSSISDAKHAGDGIKLCPKNYKGMHFTFKGSYRNICL